MPGELKGYVGSAQARGSGHKPAQKGTLSGTALGTTQPLSRNVEWQVDTGSDIVVIPTAIANLFNLKTFAGGGTGQGITGGLNLVARKGLTVSFEVEDANGVARIESRPVTVYVGGSGHVILGMHVLAVAQAQVTWKPSTSSGKLTAP